MTETWIGIIGIVVALVVPFFGTISVIVGWLILRAVWANDSRVDKLEGELDDLKDTQEKTGNRITRLEAQSYGHHRRRDGESER